MRTNPESNAPPTHSFASEVHGRDGFETSQGDFNDAAHEASGDETETGSAGANVPADPAPEPPDPERFARIQAQLAGPDRSPDPSPSP